MLLLCRCGNGRDGIAAMNDDECAVWYGTTLAREDAPCHIIRIASDYNESILKNAPYQQ
jgi:hypothetical protein